MKLNKTITAKLVVTNLAEVQRALTKEQANAPVFGLLLLIADVLDNIGKGGDYYMIIGSTQKKDAYSFTIKGTDAPGAVYADSLAGLGQQAVDFL